MIELLIAAAISSRSSFSSSRSYSAPRSSSTSTRISTTKTPTTAAKAGVSSSKVGTSRLSSRTPAPQPHTYNGSTYNSSAAPYTNMSGLWVYYWLFVTTQNGKKETQCFDKNHKRTTCNRDSKSYQKDW